MRGLLVGGGREASVSRGQFARRSPRVDGDKPLGFALDCESQIEARARNTPHKLTDRCLRHPDGCRKVVLPDAGISEVCEEVAHAPVITDRNIIVKNKYSCLAFARRGEA